MNSEDTRLKPSQVVDPQAPTVVESLPPSSDGISPGTLLVNTYRVQRMLGDGGMGEVYQARHTGLGTEHAIKVIRAELARDQQVMDLFYREARVLRGVRNDAVVSYDGFVRDEHGRDYLVMELAQGPSLADRMKQGPLTGAEVLTLRDRLAAGLAEAHRKGAVHRDISPDNVILCGGRIDSAKLIDFGIAKLTDPGQETIIGDSFAGKYRYASPEQLGLYDGPVDARTDVYSLGLILAGAAFGRPLDMGNSLESANRARQSVPDLSSLPPELRDWLTAMLEPDPSARVPSMDALLRRWPADGAGTEHGTGSRGWLPWGLGLGVVVLLAVFAGRYWVFPPVAEDSGGSKPQTSAAAISSQDQAPAVTTEVDAQTGAESTTEPGSGSAAGPDVSAEPPVETDAPQGIAALTAAGRLDQAFALAREALGSGTPPSPDALWSLAQALRDDGRLDEAFFLAREIASKGHGPAAYMLARMYDPVDWSSADSPFSRPNSKKARDWYRVAAEAGVSAADERLEQLTAGGADQ